MGKKADEQRDHDDQVSRDMSYYDSSYDSSLPENQEKYEDLEATEGMTNDEIGEYYRNKKR